MRAITGVQIAVCTCVSSSCGTQRLEPRLYHVAVFRGRILFQGFDYSCSMENRTSRSACCLVRQFYKHPMVQPLLLPDLNRTRLRIMNQLRLCHALSFHTLLGHCFLIQILMATNVPIVLATKWCFPLSAAETMARTHSMNEMSWDLGSHRVLWRVHAASHTTVPLYIFYTDRCLNSDAAVPEC